MWYTDEQNAQMKSAFFTDRAEQRIIAAWLEAMGVRWKTAFRFGAGTGKKSRWRFFCSRSRFALVIGQK